MKNLTHSAPITPGGKAMKSKTVCESCGFDWHAAVGEVADHFAVCGRCGTFMPRTARIVRGYLSLLGISRSLPNAVRLIRKGELVAAVRDASITLEETVRRKTNLSARGVELMDRAFGFEYDRAARRVTRRPKIRLNNLRTETKRNEQDGLRLIAMGLMRGARNIFAHSSGTSKFYHCLNIVTTVEWVLNHIASSDGTVAEDRSMLRLSIPKIHRTHDISQRDSSPTDRTVTVHCNSCNVDFVARWRAVVQD